VAWLIHTCDTTHSCNTLQPFAISFTVCCSVLQCVAVCCSVLQRAAVSRRRKRATWLNHTCGFAFFMSHSHGSFTNMTRLTVALCCNVLQCLEEGYVQHCYLCLLKSSRMCLGRPGKTLRDVASKNTSLQHTATHYNILQHTATSHVWHCFVHVSFTWLIYKYDTTHCCSVLTHCCSVLTHCCSVLTHCCSVLQRAAMYRKRVWGGYG